MKKENRSTWVLGMVFCIGLVLMLYPSIANWWNEKVSSRAVIEYNKEVSGLTQEDYDYELQKAIDYNTELGQISAPLVNYDKIPGYEEILNIGGKGLIGYIEIPKINLELPIYHGVSNSVLNSATGHLPGTSLPVGGTGTHSVISAHRGLPSAALFTYLDKLQEGDTFMITVLNELLTYEVDQIRIVAPNETENLVIDPEKDYVTLLTCTPYGINTDRLLVRGHRIENDNGAKPVLQNEALELDSLLLAPVLAAFVYVVLFIVLIMSGKQWRKAKNKSRN